MSKPGSTGYGWRAPAIVVAAGCLITIIGFGVRASFGLFLEPMTVDNGWTRESFAIAIAIQNLLWGLGVPVAGMLADRFGPVPIIAVGGVIYALGMLGMANADSAFMLSMTAGLLTGIGVAFTSFSLALAAMAKVVRPEKRSTVMGLGTAAGSFGQVIFSPLAYWFIQDFGWFGALYCLAAITLVLLPLAFMLPNLKAGDVTDEYDQTMPEALREALGNKSYGLLTTGFFVCGFHVAFVVTHFPAYVKDQGLAVETGAIAISLIGAFNIIGAFAAGIFGNRCSKKYLLSILYFLRANTMMFMLLAPMTEMTIYIFSILMGILWLSAVPLTTTLIAQIFGVRYIATLFGIVFLNHQLGSVLGVWLGGWAFDNLGSYDAVWWAGVALGFFAAIVHLPINETPLVRGPSLGGIQLATAGQAPTAEVVASTGTPAVSNRLPEMMVTVGACLVIGSLLAYMAR